jgi:tRNA nucleotidyltransferase/poly(A) polymerase
MEPTEEVHMLPVGGWVRDGIRRVRSKDLDVVAVWPEGLESMGEQLGRQGIHVHHLDHSKGTARGRIEDPELAAIFGTADLDVVNARVDSLTSDGRNPDWTRPCTWEEGIFPDLERRDFTVNAMAMEHDGSIIDPHGGLADLESMTLRFVGDPAQRIREDAVRILRALRFAIVKGFTIAPETWDALNSDEAAECLLDQGRTRFLDKIDKEVSLMLAFDPVASMKLLVEADHLHESIFRNGFHLAGSRKQRKFS